MVCVLSSERCESPRFAGAAGCLWCVAAAGFGAVGAFDVTGAAAGLTAAGGLAAVTVGLGGIGAATAAGALAVVDAPGAARRTSGALTDIDGVAEEGCGLCMARGATGSEDQIDAGFLTGLT